MVTSISHSPAETLSLGETWGRTAGRGTLICLHGDLGAGKTQLVKGIARGLGIGTRVLSPTFALFHAYTEGRLPLVHLDLYRLENPEQIHAAGLEEYLSPEGVTVVEWAEHWFGGKPGGPTLNPGSSAAGKSTRALRLVRWVELEVMSESERSISYEDVGP
jgi:tRNA threonylcarbamoyladenosine biosynthesis protein TsaE